MSATSAICRPFRTKANWGLIIGRAVSLLVLGATAVTGWNLLAWISALILTLLCIISWGGHVLLITNLKRLPRFTASGVTAGQAAPTTSPWVSIISPGQNGSAQLEPAISSQAGQDYSEYEVLAIDDHSTDASYQILTELSMNLPRLRVLQAPPSTQGMSGINHVMSFGVQHVNQSCVWLLFTDSRVVFDPQILRQAVALAEEQHLDFLTCIPYFVNATLGEELLVPLVLRTLLAQAQSSEMPGLQPVGVGPFMLVRREIYLATGGHVAIHAHPYHDAILAQLVAQQGGKLQVAWTSDSLQLRQYSGWQDILQRLETKSRVIASDSAPYQFGSALMRLLLLVAPLPFALFVLVRLCILPTPDWVLGLAGVLASLIYMDQSTSIRSCRAACQMRRGLPWFHPVAGILRAWVECRGAWMSFLKQPLRWRGRLMELPKDDESG